MAVRVTEYAVFTVPPGSVVVVICGGLLELLEAPIPDMATVCWPPAALSRIVKTPVLVPVVVGVNFTLTVQDVPAACEMERPQVPMPPQV